MDISLLVSPLLLFRDIIFSPRDVFKRIKSGAFLYEAVVLFIAGSIAPFFKTSLLTETRFTFFENDMLNEALSLLCAPKIAWVLHYISFFLFLLAIWILCKLFTQPKIRSLFLCLMVISGIGIFMQVVVFAFRLIFSDSLNLVFNYLAFAWCIILSVMAIKYSQNVSLGRSTILFILPAVPVIFIFGYAGILPYLAWLTV